MYTVMIINQNVKISINNCHPPLEETVDLCFAKGMLGAMPVFETREDAEAYADGNEIIELIKKPQLMPGL